MEQTVSKISSPTVDSDKRPRGRPRSAASRDSILRVALEMATSESYSAITMERIASEAGVGKQTLYRWWPSKASVIFEALIEHSREEIGPVLSADAEGDLRAFLERTFRVLNTNVGRAVRMLMAEAQQDPEFAVRFREEFILQRRSVLKSLILRVREDAPAEFLADLVFGTMWYRLLVEHAPLDDALAGSLVQVVLGLGD